MAHELDFQKGKAAFLSFRESAWHGLGTIVNDEMTIKQVLPLAGLDFTVEKHPNIHRLPNGTEIVSGDSFFTMRTDTNFVLGTRLGKGYTVMQNTEALGVLDGLVSTGKIIVETAGALKDGRIVFITCKVKEPLQVNGKDMIDQYIVLVTGHDGGTAIQVFFTSVRVVCMNTLGWALQGAKNKHSIRHTTNAADNLNNALKIMGLAEETFKLSKEAFEALTRIQLNQQGFWNFVGNVVLDETEIKQLQKGKSKEEVISKPKQRMINGIIHYAEAGVGQKEAGIGSAWWAYNSITGYFANAKGYKDAESRMENLVWGSAATTMEKAFTLALEPELVMPLSRTAKSIVENMSMN